MKFFTLFVTLASVVTVNAQFGGTPPNCTLPADYIVGNGDKMTIYQDPLKNCISQCGLQTPGVGGNNPANLVFPAESPRSTLMKSFNLFIFDANLTCASSQDFKCATFVTLYIVPESYNSTLTPSAADIYGQSQSFIVKAFGQANTVTVDFNKAYDPNLKYRVFMNFDKGTTCVFQGVKFIIDVIPQRILPIIISSFLVGRTNSSVTLSWKTEIEMIGNFEVQRSFDNSTFQTIAIVAGGATGASTISYTYVDNTNTSKSISFYRIKVVKQIGDVDYSDIKTVKGFGIKAGLVLFPNPSFGNLKITITDINEPTNVKVVDNLGRLIKSLLLTNSNTVEIKGLQKGTYMVRITGTGSGITTGKKLTVIN